MTPTAEEVAAQLQVPKSWVYRQARSGHLPSVPCGRYVRFDPDDLADWIARRKSGPRAPDPVTLRAVNNEAAPAVQEHPGARPTEVNSP